jgi:hypothetical protein
VIGWEAPHVAALVADVMCWHVNSMLKWVLGPNVCGTTCTIQLWPAHFLCAVATQIVSARCLALMFLLLLLLLLKMHDPTGMRR